MTPASPPRFPPAIPLTHPSRRWSFDVNLPPSTPAGPTTAQWTQALEEMTALEAGALANSDEQRQVGHFWLRAPESAPTIGQARGIGETAVALRQTAQAIRKGELRAEDVDVFTDVVHIGIGGSSLGPQLLVEALGHASPAGLRIHFLDNLDPHQVQLTLDTLQDRLRSTLVLTVTKSGTTRETTHLTQRLHQAMTEQGLSPTARAIAITAANSPLAIRAKKDNWLRCFHLWDFVGGRFSVTSAAGCFTAELAGVDSQGLLRGAREMDTWTRTPQIDQNPAAALAHGLYALGHGRGDCNLAVIPYSNRLARLPSYLQQLFMESLGKHQDRNDTPVHQGLTVFGNRGTPDQHAILQQLSEGRHDAAAMLIQILDHGAADTGPHTDLGDGLQSFLLGTRRALIHAQRPVFTVTLRENSATCLGGLIAMFERTVGLYASLIDINAYNQPGVEASKRAASALDTLRERLLPALSKTHGRTAAEFAGDLETDMLETTHVLERLVATGRAKRQEGPNGDTYRLCSGAHNHDRRHDG